jgi:pimeloyl-ACP methyl ester carboxylesterase
MVHTRPMHRLILLPGLACDDALFRDQWPALRALGDVQVSDVHTRFDTLPEMAAALLAEQGADFALAGCSMGGMLALEIWRQAPQRVRGLALLGTSARPDTPELITLRRWACDLYARGRMDEVLRPNVMLAFHPRNAADPVLLADYLAMMARAGAAQLIRQNQAVMARPDSRPLLAEIACPTLVVGGEADGLTPPECAREIAAGIAGAELHLLDDAGHMLSWESPQRVTALLAHWWRSL